MVMVVGVDACIDPRADASIRPYIHRAHTFLFYIILNKST